MGRKSNLTINSNMKLQDLAQPILEDKERKYPNPLPSIDMSHPLFSQWTDVADYVESELVDQYKQENNIEKLAGREYGNAVKIMRERVGSVVSLPISSLTATEPYLDEDHLNAILNNTKRLQTSSKIPVVYKLGDKFIIGDGNHRIVAEYKSGAKKIKALLVDLDKLVR